MVCDDIKEFASDMWKKQGKNQKEVSELRELMFLSAWDDSINTYRFYIHLYDDKDIEVNDELKENIAQAIKEKILKDFDKVVNIGKYTETHIDKETGKEVIDYNAYVIV